MAFRWWADGGLLLDVYWVLQCVYYMMSSGICSEIVIIDKVSEYDQKIPRSHTADRPRHREEESQNNNSHRTSGRQTKSNRLFPIKMIEKLEGHKVLQNKTSNNNRTPTMGTTINKETTTTEPHSDIRKAEQIVQ